MAALPPCPKCSDNAKVRKLSDSQSYVKYWCGECRTPFQIPKTVKQIRKEHPPK